MRCFCRRAVCPSDVRGDLSELSRNLSPAPTNHVLCSRRLRPSTGVRRPTILGQTWETVCTSCPHLSGAEIKMIWGSIDRRTWGFRGAVGVSSGLHNQSIIHLGRAHGENWKVVEDRVGFGIVVTRMPPGGTRSCRVKGFNDTFMGQL